MNETIEGALNSNNHSDALSVILPMRAGSKRIPGKNRKQIAGKPLFFWILEALHQIESVTEVLISTDDPEISQLVTEHGNFEKVRVIARPSHLADDNASMLDVISHSLDYLHSETVMQLHATSPLLRPSTLKMAIESYFSLGYPNRRSLMGVTKFEGRLWSHDGEPTNHKADRLLPTQDMPRLYLDCSAFYLFTKTGFLRFGSRTYGPPIFQLVEDLEAWDVDYDWQFLIAEKLLESRDSA